MKRLTVILLVLITIVLPISATAFNYTVDEETGIKLYELPNGVKDEIIDGKLIKRVSDEVVLEGSYDWVKSGSNQQIDVYSVEDWPTVYNCVEITSYKNKKSMVVTSKENNIIIESSWNVENWGEDADIGIYTYNNKLHIIAKKHLGLITIEMFKQYLEQYPITLIYELEVPEVYNLEPIKGHHKVKLLINEFSLHIKNIAIAISKTITEFFYNGEAITARGILFFAYVATVFCLSVLAIVFKRR